MSAVTFKVNTSEFTRTLRAYANISRREPAVICNTKAFYIARGATRETPKADAQKIKAELRGSRTKNIILKSGKERRTKYTLAQLIILARRAAAGQSTKKKDMAEDVKKFIAARVRSVAFIKSGWLPAIKRLEPLAARIGAAPRLTKSTSGQQYGQAKGSAKPARENDVRAVCQITNDALPKSHGALLERIIHHFHNPSRDKVLTYAEPALQTAFDNEQGSMLKYIEDRSRANAKRLGIKTN